MSISRKSNQPPFFGPVDFQGNHHYFNRVEKKASEKKGPGGQLTTGGIYERHCIHHIFAWNSKQPALNGCFIWMILIHDMKNSCFTKHPFKAGCFRVPGVFYA